MLRYLLLRCLRFSPGRFISRRERGEAEIRDKKEIGSVRYHHSRRGAFARSQIPSFSYVNQRRERIQEQAKFIVIQRNLFSSVNLFEFVYTVYMERCYTMSLSVNCNCFLPSPTVRHPALTMNVLPASDCVILL